MRIAIISDIHANFLALDAVLGDIGSQECTAIFCLGDTIGYGPDPAACVHRMRELAAVNLMGNHEAMYLATRLANRQRLRPRDLGSLWPSVELAHDQLDETDAQWIGSLPLQALVADMSLVHASLDEPAEFDYITGERFAGKHFARQATRISFHGHTHIPCIWEERASRIACYEPNEGPVALDPGCRYALGVGSVGQPRDNDPRSCYAIYTPAEDSLEFRRVPYDIGRARKRFAKAGLLGFHAQRIETGE